jgi:hypothetical protein
VSTPFGKPVVPEVWTIMTSESWLSLVGRRSADAVSSSASMLRFGALNAAGAFGKIHVRTIGSAAGDLIRSATVSASVTSSFAPVWPR